jgi:uncharacterized protein
MTKRDITWDAIDRLINVIAKKIIGSDADIHGVYGIPRGGLVPAVLLSHKLGVPLVQTVKNNTLIVDDISDSGNTLTDLLKKVNYPISSTHKLYTATVFERANTIFKPDFVGKYIDYQDWIIFPWEYQTHAVENSETLV